MTRRLRIYTEPTFSPDGRALAFIHSTSPSRNDIVIVEVSSGIRFSLFTGNARYPAWSPTGGAIAFAATATPGSTDLYVMAVNGGLPAQLTTGAQEERHPSWIRVDQ